MARDLIHERTSPRWETKFGRWVRGYGVLRLAHEMDITPHAVFHWIRGSHFPRPDYILQIITLAQGRLTVKDLYTHWQQLQAQCARETP